jgi:methionyl-tRNA formyltransferase
MKIFLMADYWAGYEIAKYLKNQNEDIVGLAIHPTKMENHTNKGFTSKIIDILDLSEDKIYQGEDIQNGKYLDEIRKSKPDIILCIFWGYILKPIFYKIATQGCINIHLGYLPYNRGKNPNVWAIIDETPAGVTLHYIDENIDTGAIIAQTEIRVSSVDTGKSLYDKLVVESVELFKRTWPKLKKGSVKSRDQIQDNGTFHYGKHLRRLDVLNLDQKYTGKEFINILRAKTFLPYPSAYFTDEEGKKVFVRVQLEYAE